MAIRILMIEDDVRLAGMVREYLGEHGFELSLCETGRLGLAALESETFEAVLLDVMLPDLDGFEVCRRIRAHSNLPIIMLTARGEETDRIVGLEIGADDYLPKPFSLRELAARLRAVLRRSGQLAENGHERSRTLRFGSLEIDPDARTVRRNGQICELTSHQFDLLRILAERAGRVVSRDQLMEQLQGTSHQPFDRSIDVHVSRIRAAIEEDPKNPTRIMTVRGTGYVFSRAPEESR